MHADVHAPSNEVISKSFTIPYFRSRRYFGIKSPGYFLDVKQPQKFQIVSVGPDGKIVDGAAQVKVTRRDWNCVWEDWGYRGSYQCKDTTQTILDTRIQIDLTSAFSFIGRAGRPIAPRAVEVATTADGRRWTEPIVERPPVFSEEIAYLLWDILSDPDARKPMFGDRVPLELPFKVALKSGTTKAYTDLWAIGVTREYTVGVWAGNFDGSPTYHVMSTEGATPLVRAVYTAIAARFGAPTEPARPPTIVAADICPLSGKLPGPHCEHRKRELFIAGHLPEATCDWHQVVCGQPAVVYPPQIRPWAGYSGKPDPPLCTVASANAPLAITAPANGAHFILEPYRAATSQRPLLAASPAGPALRWTIDGVPADRWVPTPGTHRVVATRGNVSDEVAITYE